MTKEKNIKRAKLHYQMGLDALQKNLLPKAFEELMKSEKIDPTQAETLDALGYAWRLRGDLDKSEAYYKRAIRAGGGSTSLDNYGSLLLQLGRFAEAKEKLEKALSDPRYRNQFIALVNLGDAQLGLKEYEDAIASYKKAGSFGFRQFLTRIKEARTYEVWGKLGQAQALYDSMLAEDPTNRQIIESYLNMLIDQKRFSEARQQLIAFRNRKVSDADRQWADKELLKLGRNR